jgi:hypothetical protein
MARRPTPQHGSERRRQRRDDRPGPLYQQFLQLGWIDRLDQMAVVPRLSDAVGHLTAFHPWEANVHQHHVRLFGHRRLQGFRGSGVAAGAGQGKLASGRTFCLCLIGRQVRGRRPAFFGHGWTEQGQGRPALPEKHPHCPRSPGAWAFLPPPFQRLNANSIASPPSTKLRATPLNSTTI